MDSFISPDNMWVLWAILASISAISIWLEQKYNWANKVTGCVIALVIAMLLSNFNIIPTDAPTYDAIWSYVVPLAIPLLLYNANIKRIWKESGRLLVIYLISGLGTVLGGIIAFHLLKNNIAELYKVTGMMVGSYTGGSVNFVAMSDAFTTTDELVSAAVVADNLLMALYFFVLIALPATSFMMKHFSHPIIDEIEKNGTSDTNKTQAAEFWGAKEISLQDIAFAVASSFVIVAISSNLAAYLGGVLPQGGFAKDMLHGLLSNKYLLMTTFTMLGATFAPQFFGGIRGSREIGTFLIYLFFTVLGVPASIMLIIQKSPLLLVFCAIIVLINLLVTLGFGKLLKFDVEEIILASNANIGGPTTAAAMAIAKGWEKLIVPTLLVGTLGYVIGNYYGLFVGTFLQ